MTISAHAMEFFKNNLLNLLAFVIFLAQSYTVIQDYEYQDMGYMVGDVDDYQENVTIVEPWEPGEKEAVC